MYLGRLVEVADADILFRRPAHHYSRALIDAIPLPDPQRRRLFAAPIGELPSPRHRQPAATFIRAARQPPRGAVAKLSACGP
jgi:ABC-type oligopeptide transport system ATPase subunit